MSARSSPLLQRGPGYGQLLCGRCGRLCTVAADCRSGPFPPNECECEENRWRPLRKPGLTGEAWQRHGPDIEGPECWALLDDAEGVLSDRSRLPRGLCREMMRESTDRWSDLLAPRDLADWNACKCYACEQMREKYTGESQRYALARRVWPLPIGTAVLGHAFTEGSAFHALEYGEKYHVQWAPLGGEEHAAFALRVCVDGATIDLFGTVSASSAWEVLPKGRRTAAFVSSGGGHPGTKPFGGDPVNWLFGPLKVRLSGEPSETAWTLVKQARWWWRKAMEGRRVFSPGRPVDSGYFSSPEAFARHLAPLVRQLGERGTHPSAMAVARVWVEYNKQDPANYRGQLERWARGFFGGWREAVAAARAYD